MRGPSVNGESSAGPMNEDFVLSLLGTSKLDLTRPSEEYAPLVEPGYECSHSSRAATARSRPGNPLFLANATIQDKDHMMPKSIDKVLSRPGEDRFSLSISKEWPNGRR